MSVNAADGGFSSIFNLEEFPQDIQDIIDFEYDEFPDFTPVRATDNGYLEEYFTNTTEEEETDSSSVSRSSSPFDEDDEEDDCVSQPRRRRSSNNSSNDGDLDDDWKPEKRRRLSNKTRSTPVETTIYHQTSKKKPPTPQKRSAGSSCKMVQWIVSLLRDPSYNPSVITWVDELNGVFTIKDTVQYAKLWGKRKNNREMNYEKLSRGMRYYYRNGELEAIRDKRLTYKFGPTATDFRALNQEDPNFTLLN